MELAKQVQGSLLSTEEGYPTVWWWRGTWMVYDEVKGWRASGKDWAESFCYRVVDGLVVQKYDGRTRETSNQRWTATLSSVRELTKCLEMVCERDPFCEVPSWTTGAQVFDADFCISFRDAVVGVGTGEVDVRTRTANWFDTMTVQTDYDGFAECPRWVECVESWGEGMEGWGRLLQEWMGYCLMPTTKYAKWMFMMGRPRSGKGTITKVLEELMGGGAYLGISLYDFGSNFGLHGLETARALVVNEVSELDKKSAERATQVVKSVLGQDSISIDRKNQDVLRNVRVDATITMVSNQVVQLPNRGQGLGSKMLVLPFRQSWMGHEDFGLFRELRGEMQGIAAWAVEGARRLVENRGVFSVVEGADETEREFRMVNNPIDAFLEARFEPNPASWTSSAMVLRQYESWCRSVGEPIQYNDRTLIRAILGDSTWRLERRRRGDQNRRGLQGMVLRRYYQDDEES